MENSSVTQEVEAVNNVENQVFTDKQPKTTYSFRVSPEQKEILQNLQRDFASQGDFVTHVLNCLQGGIPQPVAEESDVLNIKLSEYQRNLLMYVAERESTEDVEVFSSDVLLYVFDEMLVKGNKFSIRTIPDKVINQYKELYNND
jgi:hypothetical protein